ncbi:nucleotidyltransferase family protein [Shewanella litorisediminis]|uniref:Nucleotidyltransferase family protein n=1 Tax=Shewanella litorisediminis TaxID=1173586 RepID=A0ABX7G012_9GAMM|nr:nucleotidyltransferase family protein [Shewanella litorisediminis]MCL2918341.1 nucleotidyltransferase family protein [Shewanella litorisediminis]QRH00612.1 nucleotidyltransferase family protein [Shewanella litorisediminis]
MNCYWKNVLIKSDDSIRNALEIINREALRVALVVDKEQNLVGVVTDGDIRRGLLNNLCLSDGIAMVMNTNPTTAQSGTPKQDLVELMQRKGIISVPLLKNGKIVGLETLQSALTRPTYPNPVLIMAGGFGSRLKPLTDDCPKPMLKIGQRPILETLIMQMVKCGFEHFYVSTHYMPEKIHSHFGDGKNFGANITYVHEDVPLGTGGALGLVKDKLQDDLPLIVINGDVLTTVNFERLLEFHLINQADATMCVREYEYQVPYGVITTKGKKISGMVEKPVQHFFVNAGIYVVSPAVYKSVEPNSHIDMPALLEKHMHARDRVYTFPIHEYWLDIGRMDEFNKAQSDIEVLGIN